MSTRALLPVVGLVLWVGACSTTKYQGPVVTPAAVTDIRAENRDHALRIEVTRNAGAPGVERGSNLPELASVVDVTQDHTTLTLSSDAAAHVVPNDSIRRIIVIHRGDGAFVGVGVGVLLGVAAAVAAAATYSDCSASYVCFSRGDSSVLAGFVVGIPATLIGAGLGAAIGNRTNYTFGPPTADRVN